MNILRSMKVVPSLLIFASFLLTTVSWEEASGEKSRWKFLPSKGLFDPLRADPREIQLGWVVNGDGEYEGIIGKSFGILSFEIKADTNSEKQSTMIQLGMGGGSFSLLEQERLRFPLEAVDYVLTACVDFARGPVSIHLKNSHICAHLGDGNRNFRKPITYSRDFVTLLFSYTFSSVRFYSGAHYFYHTVPHFSRFSLQIGGHWDFKRSSKSGCLAYIAYDFKLKRESDLVLNQTVQVGVRFFNDGKRGFRLPLIYHAGRSEQGQFYNVEANYLGVGIFFDF